MLSSTVELGYVGDQGLREPDGIVYPLEDGHVGEGTVGEIGTTVLPVEKTYSPEDERTKLAPGYDAVEEADSVLVLLLDGVAV